MKKILTKTILTVLLVGGFAFVAEEVQQHLDVTSGITPNFDPGDGVRPST